MGGEPNAFRSLSSESLGPATVGLCASDNEFRGDLRSPFEFPGLVCPLLDIIDRVEDAGERKAQRRITDVPKAGPRGLLNLFTIFHFIQFHQNGHRDGLLYYNAQLTCNIIYGIIQLPRSFDYITLKDELSFCRQQTVRNITPSSSSTASGPSNEGRVFGTRRLQHLLKAARGDNL